MTCRTFVSIVANVCDYCASVRASMGACIYVEVFFDINEHTMCCSNLHRIIRKCHSVHVDVTVSDINECDRNTDDCSEIGSVCENIPGSYRCSCMDGYIGNGKVCNGTCYIWLLVPRAFLLTHV